MKKWEVSVDVTISGTFYDVEAETQEEAEAIILEKMRGSCAYDWRNMHYLSSEIFESYEQEEE